jgi:hypothetical protein
MFQLFCNFQNPKKFKKHNIQKPHNTRLKQTPKTIASQTPPSNISVLNK